MSREKKVLPLLITRGAVVFPTTFSNIDVGRLFSVSAMQKSLNESNSKIIVVAQKDISINEPTENDISLIGSLCTIDNVKEINGVFRLRVTSISRIKISKVNSIIYQDKPSFECEYTLFPIKKDEDENTIISLYTEVLDYINDKNNMVPLPRPILYKLQAKISPEDFTNVLGNYLEMNYLEKQKFLEENSLINRLNFLKERLISSHLEEKIESDINRKVRDRSEQAQKDYILREKLRAIQDELGDGDDEDNVDQYLGKLDKNPYPENVKKKVKSEINHYKQLPAASVESSMVKAYIDTMMSIPWFEESKDNDNIKHAEEILNEDHYGLKKVKERILEYLAVKSVTKSLKAPILCLYGPPGTGKTSLAKSIARALNRKFVKASLGGTSDEAEIRGHRRTYVASMPGKIIKGMKQAGVINPVFLLDEIDKITSNIHGDPASALLEVLDPEQNSFFQDNYVEETYDLSKVLFIATANYLENIPPALRDRLELIELNSYTNEEKYHIAIEHLIPKQCKQNGLTDDEIKFDDDTLYYIMNHYTREAGVRELERKIGTIIRKTLVQKLKDGIDFKNITIEKVKEYLGTEYFDESSKEKENQVGVVTGLAYTEFGGDILPIEVTYFEGKGGLVLTGNLGNIMKESATIALDYVRANAEKYHINPELFAKNDIHIHVPEGAVPKDGPSAGIALTVGIISALTNRKVSADVAMTGEVTLRGKAFPIGGLKEKSLAAYRSGIKKVLIPRENEKNLHDLPNVVKENIKFVLLDDVDQALKEALCEND